MNKFTAFETQDQSEKSEAETMCERTVSDYGAEIAQKVREVLRNVMASDGGTTGDCTLEVAKGVVATLDEEKAPHDMKDRIIYLATHENGAMKDLHISEVVKIMKRVHNLQ